VIIFIYLGMFINGGFLPPQGEAFEIPNLLAMDIRGISVLWVAFTGSPWSYLLILALGVGLGWFVSRWRGRTQDATGKPTHPFLSGFVVFLAVAIVGWLALGGPIEFTAPSVGADGRITGGNKLTPEYAALLVGLVLYTASHVAEITRGSIQAVARGQDEAAKALGLTPGQRLRKVILPQALRVAIPPLSNQYLNLTKNSSLAVAIAYVEMTRVTSDLVANGAPAFQAFLLLAFLYLLISLATALITNAINSRLAIPGR
jgi:general L-amino acid transport system permease protein